MSTAVVFMGFWHVADGRLLAGLPDQGAGAQPAVEEVPLKEAAERMPGAAGARVLAQLPYADVPFAEAADSSAAGVVVAPDRRDPFAPPDRWCFALSRDGLVLAGEGPFCSDALEGLAENPVPVPDAASVLAEVLRRAVQGEALLLSRVADRLRTLEDAVLDGACDVDRRGMHADRRLLLGLAAFYRGMEDLAEELSEDAAAPVSDEARARLASLGRHLGRLAARAEGLHGQVLQLGSMCQENADARQNRVMRWLTVVATVFMPLTFVTSWYGMNFPHMGLTGADWGYPAVCVACVLIAAAEIAWFRSKGWLSFSDRRRRR